MGRRDGWRKPGAFAAVALLIMAGHAGTAGAAAVAPLAEPQATSTGVLLRRVGSSVCRITVIRGDYYDEWKKLFRQYQAHGVNKFKLATRQHVIMSHSTCVVVDDQRGVVVTNEHVVHGMADYDHFEMQLAGAPERIPLKLLGVDKETDLAVLKVANDAQLPLPAAHVVWGDSDQLEPGEVVVAVGYPGQGYEIGRDTYFWNATVGILSGLPRQENLTEFIQTTANTDKGYSGGCVFNLRGECVGITAEVEGRGLNFAVASNLARRIVAEIVEHGRVRRGALGTIWDEVKWVRPVDAVEVGLTIDAWQRFIDKALVVLSVAPGEAADRAGLQRGDLILSIDGSPATWSSGMQRYVASKKPGDVLRIEVFRASGNRQFEVAVTLGDRDQAVGSIGTE